MCITSNKIQREVYLNNTGTISICKHFVDTFNDGIGARQRGLAGRRGEWEPVRRARPAAGRRGRGTRRCGLQATVLRH